jgi:hypothetical protein
MGQTALGRGQSFPGKSVFYLAEEELLNPV